MGSVLLQSKVAAALDQRPASFLQGFQAIFRSSGRIDTTYNGELSRPNCFWPTGQLSITDIGQTLGYSQTSSFSVAFRKLTGWTPTEYRRGFE